MAAAGKWLTASIAGLYLQLGAARLFIDWSAERRHALTEYALPGVNQTCLAWIE